VNNWWVYIVEKKTGLYVGVTTDLGQGSDMLPGQISDDLIFSWVACRPQVHWGRILRLSRRGPANLALIRLLEIIGEAATRIPKKDQARYTDISWPEIEATTELKGQDGTERMLFCGFQESLWC
jgi:hypothetical protein